MTQQKEKQYLQTLGARILSEANDLKRTPEALANELGYPQDQIRSVIAGESDLETAQGVIHAMAQAYPVSIADLWVEYDDTDHGVRIITASDSSASSRVFDRRDRSGGLSQYYEYRDTAMSRTAPFKPEWIKELRVVSDAEPDNPDVAYNNGHLMHQTTFFVGPVNFYWELNERRQCVELNTGDSNYVTPFVPHSFASRQADNLGYIVAVTYGAEARRAASDLGRLDPEAFSDLAADPRQPDKAFAQLLARQAAAESLTRDQLVGRLNDAGFDKERARQVVVNGGATADEIEVIAAALNVRTTDLTVSPLSEEEEVVVRRRANSAPRNYPDSEAPTYVFTELARTKHQPLLKGFDVSVLGGGNGDMRHSLHEYIFNYGDVPTEMFWGDGHHATLQPGDSAYVRPTVSHRFDKGPGGEPGQLVMIRIPGALTGSVVNEISTYAPQGRDRIAKERQRWF
jgi:methylphosphonate synthase